MQDLEGGVSSAKTIVTRRGLALENIGCNNEIPRVETGLQNGRSTRSSPSTSPSMSVRGHSSVTCSPLDTKQRCVGHFDAVPRRWDAQQLPRVSRGHLEVVCNQVASGETVQFCHFDLGEPAKGRFQESNS